MNPIQQLFFAAIATLSFSTVSAQYGYGNSFGRQSQMGMSQMNQTPSKPKEIPVEETVEKIMEKLKPELNLDALQEIAIANVYTDMVKSQGAIMKNDKMSQEEKSNEIKVLFEVNERKINEYLNEEQKEKFKALKEDKQKSKKSKKKKR